MPDPRINALVTSIRADVDAELAKLGSSLSDEVKPFAEELMQVYAEIAFAKLAGEDTALAEQAAASAAQNLAALGAMQVAAVARASLEKAIQRALSVVASLV